jgi:hypothetical protein
MAPTHLALGVAAGSGEAVEEHGPAVPPAEDGRWLDNVMRLIFAVQ